MSPERNPKLAGSDALNVCVVDNVRANEEQWNRLVYALRGIKSSIDWLWLLFAFIGFIGISLLGTLREISSAIEARP